MSSVTIFILFYIIFLDFCIHKAMKLVDEGFVINGATRLVSLLTYRIFSNQAISQSKTKMKKKREIHRTWSTCQLYTPKLYLHRFFWNLLTKIHVIMSYNNIEYFSSLWSPVSKAHPEFAVCYGFDLGVTLVWDFLQ